MRGAVAIPRTDDTHAKKEKEPEPPPRPMRVKRPLGRVKLVVGASGETAELHGVVYGLEQEIAGEGFRARLLFDAYNRRLKVLDYHVEDYRAFADKLGFLADSNRFDKIWILARPKDWERFVRLGYMLEGTLRYALRGKTAYMVSQFRSNRRLRSPELRKEIDLLDRILARELRPTPRRLPAGYSLDFAREEDLEGILALYRRVFETYPSPLTHREYLIDVLHRGSVFRVVRNPEGEVASVASAELSPEHLSAELTDCATHPAERGRGLMSVILKALEQDLRRLGYRCAYTLARAPSFGMNAAFHALGYEFNGRMINNCDIYGGFEDMNLWSKDLRQRRPRQKAGPVAADPAAA
ncbi:MAG TPA: putative beta-lysine N-acetyltransferase [Vulgatibacter sp.]|nr:putative beta-lysine N-acetyltransferase [Vulgatibacter sp.]